METIKFWEGPPHYGDGISTTHFQVRLGELSKVLKLWVSIRGHNTGGCNRFKTTTHRYEIFINGQGEETTCVVLTKEQDKLFRFAQLLKEEGFLIEGDLWFTR